MRPTRLEIEGFTSFRERTVIDFADADLFALVGPTGAGKSSLIDAMVFALFGTVPRYGDARLVGSVINQRSARALVDFRFSVGERAYRIVREVARQKGGGGTTREARLEDATTGEALFDGDARQLTGAVEHLLGLTRDQFTKCVVLPQGEFQQFLHDKPGRRQDLLVQLLGAEVYGRIGELARQEQKVCSTRAQVLDDQVGSLEAQLAAEPALRDRRDALAALQEVVDELVPGLQEAQAASASITDELDRIEDHLTRVNRIVCPHGLDDVAEAVAELDEELAGLRRDEEAHAARERDAEDARGRLPAREDLVAARDRQRRRAELGERIAKGEGLVEQAAREAQEVIDAAASAAASLEREEESLEGTRDDHAAAHLAAGLGTGDDCPVCHRPLDEIPTHEGADLAAATAAAADARRRWDECAKRRDDARATLDRYVSQLDLLREQLGELGPEGDDPAEVEIEALVGGVDEADAAVAAARLARRTATEHREVSERKRQKLAKLEAAAWSEFDEARDAVALLEPPRVSRRDVSRAWGELTEWAQTCRALLDRNRAEGLAARQEIERRRLASDEALTDAFRSAGLERPVDGVGEIVAAQRARNDAEIDRLDEIRVDVTKQIEARQEAAAGEQVAGELGNLLKSNAFEKWLLDAAMRALVAGASVKLEDLSRGQYAMAVDTRSGGFLVVDHHDVDERRPARTLSGGETFLASLALALALAEQVADLAAAEAPRIESIFLDEGFGTLDPDTLEVVVAAIEELQAGGLVVGLVSHVAELAERVPTRFEVRKGPGGSTVERVDR